MVTKGTWERDGGIIRSHDFKLIADCRLHDEQQGLFDSNYGVPWEETIANVKLIAAAPDMLEALKATIDAEDSIPDYMAQIINAAIAKAEGK